MFFKRKRYEMNFSHLKINSRGNFDISFDSVESLFFKIKDFTRQNFLLFCLFANMFNY